MLLITFKGAQESLHSRFKVKRIYFVRLGFVVLSDQIDKFLEELSLGSKRIYLIDVVGKFFIEQCFPNDVTMHQTLKCRIHVTSVANVGKTNASCILVLWILEGFKFFLITPGLFLVTLNASIVTH